MELVTTDHNRVPPTLPEGFQILRTNRGNFDARYFGRSMGEYPTAMAAYSALIRKHGEETTGLSMLTLARVG